jgi:hypothetical protein
VLAGGFFSVDITQMSRFRIIAFFLPFVLSIAFGDRDGRSVKNLRVVWSEYPQTEALVIWDGRELNEGAMVLYDTVSHGKSYSDYAFKTSLYESGLYLKKVIGAPKGPASSCCDESPLFYHHAKLSNLKPGTTYYLAIQVKGETGREFHFKTAPASGTFKLIYAGDSRTRVDVVRQMSHQIAQMVEQDESIVALLHGGDFVGAPNDLGKWEKWLDAYALTTTESGRLLPLIPIVGNHDKGGAEIFFHAFGDVGGGTGRYVCHLAPSVRITCLNSMQKAAGEQQGFLQEALKKMEADKVLWRFSAQHYPSYPAVKNWQYAKREWVPLYEKYNVDLVLESDGHCIKRTVPIRNDKESPDGVVYLGEGGFGAPQRDPDPTRWYLQGGFVSKGDHIMMLDISPEAIHYSTILSSGKTVDSAIFKARER